MPSSFTWIGSDCFSANISLPFFRQRLKSFLANAGLSGSGFCSTFMGQKATSSLSQQGEALRIASHVAPGVAPDAAPDAAPLALLGILSKTIIFQEIVSPGPSVMVRLSGGSFW